MPYSLPRIALATDKCNTFEKVLHLLLKAHGYERVDGTNLPHAFSPRIRTRHIRELCHLRIVAVDVYCHTGPEGGLFGGVATTGSAWGYALYGWCVLTSNPYKTHDVLLATRMSRILNLNFY